MQANATGSKALMSDKNEIRVLTEGNLGLQRTGGPTASAIAFEGRVD